MAKHGSSTQTFISSGKYGKGLETEGYTVPANMLDISSSDFTVVFWTRANSAGRITQRIDMRDIVGVGASGLGMSTNHVANAFQYIVGLRYNTTTGYRSVTPSYSQLSANEWAMVSFTFAQTTRTLAARVNNGTVSQRSYASSEVSAGLKNVPITIGERGFSGVTSKTGPGIDSLRIYNRVLTDAELTTIYEYGSAAPDPTLPTASVVADTSITSSDGSITEGTIAEFDIVLDPAPSANTRVYYTVSQTGSYLSTGQLGAKSAVVGTSGTVAVNLATISDNVVEPDGTVTITITDGSSYNISSLRKSASFIVKSDDTAPVVNAGPPTITLTGGSSWTPQIQKGQLLTITFDVSDPNGIASVNVYAGTSSVSVGTISEVIDEDDENLSHVTWTYSTQSLALGDAVFTLTVIDAHSTPQTRNQTITATVIAATDTTGPTIRGTASHTWAYGEAVSFEISAFDASGIARFGDNRPSWLSRKRKSGTTLAAPTYVYTGTVPNNAKSGNMDIVATDTQNNTTTVRVTFTIPDTIKPIVKFNVSSANVSAGSPFSYQCIITDNLGSSGLSVALLTHPAPPTNWSLRVEGTYPNYYLRGTPPVSAIQTTPYNVGIRATDAAGNTITDSINITVKAAADTTPPTVALWSNSEPSSVNTGETITILLRIQDNAGGSGIKTLLTTIPRTLERFLTDPPESTGIANQYRITGTAPDNAVGEFTYQVIARDNANNDSQPLNIPIEVVDTIRPKIISPSDEDVIEVEEGASSTTFTFDVTATDNGTVERVNVVSKGDRSMPSALVKVGTKWKFTWSTNKNNNYRPWACHIQAVDEEGNTSDIVRLGLKVVLQNTAPNILDIDAQSFTGGVKKTFDFVVEDTGAMASSNPIKIEVKNSRLASPAPTVSLKSTSSVVRSGITYNIYTYTFSWTSVSYSFSEVSEVVITATDSLGLTDTANFYATVYKGGTSPTGRFSSSTNMAAVVPVAVIPKLNYGNLEVNFGKSNGAMGIRITDSLTDRTTIKLCWKVGDIWYVQQCNNHSAAYKTRNNKTGQVYSNLNYPLTRSSRIYNNSDTGITRGVVNAAAVGTIFVRRDADQDDIDDDERKGTDNTKDEGEIFCIVTNTRGVKTLSDETRDDQWFEFSEDNLVAPGESISKHIRVGVFAGNELGISATNAYDDLDAVAGPDDGVVLFDSRSDNYWIKVRDWYRVDRR